MSSDLPISSLDLSISPPPNTTIKGLITLVWPYSSSTRQCAFLLSDPDFRLRSKRGQVRVRFTGASAKAVAERQLGIGDVVELGLEGGRWEDMDEGVRARTPGRGVEAELVFGRKVGLGVWRGGEMQVESDRVEVDAPFSPEREGGLNGQVEAYTPAPAHPRASGDVLRRSLDSSFLNGEAGWTYASPAFAKRVRLSAEGGMLDSAYDPFVDDREEDEVSGKRTSFGPGMRWRLKSRTPSPVKESFVDVGDLTDEVEELVSPSKNGRVEDAVGNARDVATGPEMVEILGSDDAMEEERLGITAGASTQPALAQQLNPTGDPTPPTAMPPPALPRLSVPAEDPLATGPRFDDGQPLDIEGPSTPKLLPVKSPTLPLPSPFPVDSPPAQTAGPPVRPQPYTANSLFGALGSAAAVIERRRVSSGRSQQSSPQIKPLPSRKVPAVELPPAVEHAPDVAAEARPEPAAVSVTIDLTDDEDEDEDVEMLGDEAAPQEAGLDQSFSTTIPDDDMYDDYTKSLRETDAGEYDAVRSGDEDAMDVTENRPGNVKFAGDSLIEILSDDEDPVEEEGTLRDYEGPSEEPSVPTRTGPNEFSLDGAAFSTAPAPPRRSDRMASPLLPAEPDIEPEVYQTSPPQSSLPEQELPSSLPATPAKARLADVTAINNASTTPLSAQVTPQSERDRVRKTTYRSLFGLRSPTKQPAADVVPQVERAEERFIPGWFFEVGGEQQTAPENAGRSSVDAEDDVAAKVREESELGATAPAQDVEMEDKGVERVDTAPVERHTHSPSADEQKPDDRSEQARASSPSTVTGTVPAASSEVAIQQHIAPPRKAPAPSVLAPDEPSERVPLRTSPRRKQPSKAQEPPATSAQQPSYPVLPLSPSNSQSLQEVPSQLGNKETTRHPLPPTPQLTQHESSLRGDDTGSLKTPAGKLTRSQSSLRSDGKAADIPVTPQTKTPSRRSARLRTSNVPDVLSEWFSPRSSGAKAQQAETLAAKAIVEDDVAENAVTNGHADLDKRNGISALAAGFATAHSYFTPLSKLPELMNSSSQHAYGTGALDILAIVTDKTKEPVRAKTGPKDYFTIFRIADPSLPSMNDSYRVEIFRPYKDTLPTAEVGDAVLLRAFVVKSKKRTPYLLSTDASAWCVWRVPDLREAKKPVWARKGEAGNAPRVEEEIQGPPVEFGDEERAHAVKLREWWLAQQQSNDDDGIVKGKVGKDVAAKL